MRNYQLNYNDFLASLEKETNLLIDLCLQFDKGNYDYANVISTKITSIINFRGKKESLLPNMDKQDTMKFCASSKVLEDHDSIFFYRSLVSVVNSKNGIIYYPKFNQGKYPMTWHYFDKWANAPVYIINLEPEQHELNGLIYIQELNEATQFVATRRDIINFYRNKFNGAHSDLKLNTRMYKIALGLSSIDHLDNPNLKNIAGEKYIPGEPIKYMFEMAVRQIAHELILSLKKEFKFQLQYKPSLNEYLDKKIKTIPDQIMELKGENENGEKQIRMLEV